ncbi:hypothetical protein D3C71_1878560 [compost metagenome]
MRLVVPFLSVFGAVSKGRQGHIQDDEVVVAIENFQYGTIYPIHNFRNESVYVLDALLHLVTLMCFILNEQKFHDGAATVESSVAVSA